MRYQPPKPLWRKGIVAGGGVTLLQARKALLALKNKMEFEEEKTGVDIVYKALAEPIRMIAKNAGVDSGWVLKKVEEAKDTDYGFNALTLEFGSMYKQGIVDPAKVVRSALENASSVATMILTTEALITDIPEKKETQPATPSMPEEY
jgi:Chaperonin GroEL (HSP60 family)